MDFVKRFCIRSAEKAKQSRTTFDEDYNVPDAGPMWADDSEKGGDDRGCRLKKSACRFIRRPHLSSAACLRRRTAPDLPALRELPIDETIHLDGLTGAIHHHLGSGRSEPHLINSRKLGVRAIVTLHAWIEELCDLAVPMEIRGERRRGKKAGIPRG